MIPVMPSHESAMYEICIEGHLGANRIGEFESFRVELTGEGQTVLTGVVEDQAALHSVIARIRDLGIALISVNRTGAKSVARKSDRRKI